MKKVGLMGYGTIGKFIGDSLHEDPAVDLQFVLRRKAAGAGPLNFVNDISGEILEGLNLVIEAAGTPVVHEYGLEILRHTDFMVFSITSLAHEEFFEKAREACIKHNRRLFVPHGAVLGLDGIFDGRSLLTSVTITTMKTPKSFGLKKDEKAVLYEGSTRGACAVYPKNVNVHAAVALAGLGFDKTRSAIVADPEAPGNTHIIAVEGEGVKFEIKVESKSQGGVTGKYTPYSGLGSIQRLLNRKPGIHIA